MAGIFDNCLVKKQVIPEVAAGLRNCLCFSRGLDVLGTEKQQLGAIFDNYLVNKHITPR